jgi:glycosyltransferase involved in cell wall biosynthesis
MATYIDVTRLLGWQGNYTGMERFAFEVTKYVVEARTDVRLCCFTKAAGFIELHDAFSLDGDRLSSPIFGPSPALRDLVKTNKKAFVYEYAKRKQHEKNYKKLPRITAGTTDTLVIYDGLWDQEDYIMAIEQQVAHGMHLAHFVCDLVPVVMPQVCFEFVSTAFSTYFERIAPLIDTLFSISKHTEKDFQTVYGSIVKPTLKKHVIRVGDSFGDGKPEKPTQLKLSGQDYLLSVGTVEIRKNHQLLYQAYRLALELGIKLPKLIIVGREGWMAEASIYAIKHDPLIKEHILFAGPVTDAELNWLYANCICTVFPSLYEGWGLPVAESLNYGKVCAAANSSSVPEIGGELNEYYSPYNAQACLDTIVQLLNTPYRRQLEKKIQDCYTPTKWSEVGERVMKAL